MRIPFPLLLLTLFATPAQAQSAKAGIEAWQRSDHAGAVAIWRPLAERGDSDAAFNLGQAYRLGRGVPLSLSLAQTWLERAADKGHVDAQTTLGMLLFENGNRVGGMRWLKSAASKGEPRALLIYGTALFNGDGVVRDPVLAYAMVSRAAAQGLAPAKSTLAELDSVMPLEQRKKGVALALQQVTGASTPPRKPAATVQAKAAPVTPPAAKPASPAASGGWRVQLGAFGKRTSAEALFAKLSGSGPLAGKQAALVPSGAVTRLQAGPFPNKSAAQAACSALNARGQACFPVPASR